MKVLKKNEIIGLILVLSCSVGFAGYVTIGVGANDGGVDYEYQIGTTEVSIADWQASGIGGGEFWLGTVGSEAPVASITWHQAAQYCNWLTTTEGGNTLVPYLLNGSGVVTGKLSRADMVGKGTFYVMPTEAEWVKAAYFNGTSFTTYANGSSTVPGDAVYNTANPGVVGLGSVDQNGTTNMSGNVWEWLDASAGGEGLNFANSSQGMVLRGGAYHHTTAQYLQESERFTNPALVRSVATQDIGLRIAVIPEPGTISLMSLSTIGLFLSRTIRRRKRFGKTLMPVRREFFCDSFCTKEEWEHRFEENPVEAIEENSLSWSEYVQQTVESARAFSKKMDKAFWSWMVVQHERRILIQEALYEKATKKLDAFLALIMK